MAVDISVSLLWRRALAVLLVVPGAADGASDAGAVHAERHAPLAGVVALLIGLTVLVLLAADGDAAGDGVALETRGTDAAGAVEVDLADGPISAGGGGAGVDALVVLAGLVAGTVLVTDTFICS